MKQGAMINGLGDVVAAGGAATIAVGVWWVYPPVAVILVGLVILFLGIRAGLK